MIVAVALMTPLLLLVPAAARVPLAAHLAGPGAAGADSAFPALFLRFRRDRAAQMRFRIPLRVPIERGPLPPIPPPDERPALVERKMGDCVTADGIAGMVTDGDKRLILIMRDSRMISLTLERACSARDFYSGFYFNRQPDGKLCADRDTLLSRAGATCRLTRVRRLVGR